MPEIVVTVPRRIQRQRTKGWRMPEGAVYVGRPSFWGNPWRAGLNHDDVGGPDFALTREEAVGMYRQMWTTFPPRIVEAELVPLRGHDLICWCPEACGVDVALYGVAYGDLYEPCAKPRGHAGGHDPSVAPWCHADVLLGLANA